MTTSGDRSSTLTGRALFLAMFALALGCARTKAAAPAPSADVEPADRAEAGGATALDVDASEDGFQVSGTFDLSGAVPRESETGSVGGALSKSSFEKICFAPGSAKLPADTSSKLAVTVKAFRSEPNERKRITVEATISSADAQATASKVRAQRAAAIVGALVKQGLDRKAIVVTGPEVPRTEWSMSSMSDWPPFGEEPQPCVEVAIATRGGTL
ncbi:MAG: OmpA family protein [Labilithrix sp.]|nr:OmpA family protein [Labilithrix sp.]